MTFTKQHAAAILPHLTSMTVGDAQDAGILDALIALGEYARHGNRSPNTKDVYLYTNNESAVQCIKMIRQITGYGLREAKDMYDKHMSCGNTPNMGPICEKVDCDMWMPQLHEANSQHHDTGAYFYFK